MRSKRRIIIKAPFCDVFFFFLTDFDLLQYRVMQDSLIRQTDFSNLANYTQIRFLGMVYLFIIVLTLLY